MHIIANTLCFVSSSILKPLISTFVNKFNESAKLVEWFLVVSRSGASTTNGENHPTHLRGIIALCKELKVNEETAIHPSQLSRNQVVQCEVLGIHHPLGANTSALSWCSTIAANARLIGNNNLVECDNGIGIAIDEGDIDEDEDNNTECIPTPESNGPEASENTPAPTANENNPAPAATIPQSVQTLAAPPKRKIL